MTDVKTQALIRLVKVVGAVVAAAVVGWLASPNVSDVVGTQNAVLVSAVLTPIFSAVEKYFTGPTVKATA